MSASALAETPLWLEGPQCLYSEEFPPESISADPDEGPPPDDCQSEIKLKKYTHALVTVDNDGPQLKRLINLKDYSSSHRLFRVTALVLKFVHNARRGTNDNRPLSATDMLVTSNDLEQAKLLWIKDSQSQLKNDGRFPLWKRQLGLFRDEADVWKCSGRMSNSSLSLAAQTPTLLDKKTPSRYTGSHGCS